MNSAKTMIRVVNWFKPINQKLHLMRQQKQETGYVLLDLDDPVLDRKLCHQIFKRENSAAIREKNELSFWLKSSYYLRDLRAILSGNVPEQMILQVQIRPFLRIKQKLKQINHIDRRELDAKKKELDELIRCAFGGFYEKLLYAGIVIEPFEVSNKKHVPKLVVIHQSLPDSDKTNFFLRKNTVPYCVKEIVKAVDVTIVKQSIVRQHWDELKQWMVHQRIDIITSEEWSNIDARVLGKLHRSQNMRTSSLHQMMRLSTAKNLQLSTIKRNQFVFCSLVCLKYLIRVCNSSTAICLNATSLIEMLILKLNGENWINEEEEVKKQIIEVVNLLKEEFGCQRIGADEQEVDKILNDWKVSLKFENHLDNASHAISACSKRNIIIPSSSISKCLESCSFEEVLSQDQLTIIERLQAKLGFPVDKIRPSNILLISKFGSHLYNLATPASDLDYQVIFRRSASLHHHSLSFSDKLECKIEKPFPVEFDVIEARVFCLMLFKTRTQISEIVFSEPTGATDESFVHPLMQQLFDNWQVLRCQRLLQSFIGFAFNSLKRLRNCQMPHDEEVALKLLYFVHHKLLMAEDLLVGKKPRVTLHGADQDMLMSIRSGAILSQYSIPDMILESEKNLARLNSIARKINFPEYPDYSSLVAWLTAVRQTAL